VSYEWVTTFVVRHTAGSKEGAIFQRNEYDRAIAALGGETTTAVTKPGDAAGTGLRTFLQETQDDE
jgi:hypothetical protein